MHAAESLFENCRNAVVTDREGLAQTLEHAVSSGMPSLYRRAYRLLGNSADAEDAVQDALLSAYKHMDEFRGQSRMSTWLHAIVTNHARMHLRSQRRRVHVSLESPIGEEQEYFISERIPDKRPTPEDDFLGYEMSTRVNKLVEQLSPPLRNTFRLRHGGNQSIAEIALHLGVSKGTVKAQLARARSRLKESIFQRPETERKTLISVRNHRFLEMASLGE